MTHSGHKSGFEIPQRSSLPPYRPCVTLSEAREGPGSEPALVYHGVRRRSRDMVARGARNFVGALGSVSDFDKVWNDRFLVAM